MNREAMTALQLLAKVNAFPFYLEQSNSRGVWVRDARGQTVFLESFLDFPDEFNASAREGVINTAVAVANFLVEASRATEI